MNNHVILGVHITNRVKKANEVQNIFTKYGDNIKTRLGLHHTNGEDSAENGLIILELIGTKERIASLENELKSIEGLQVKTMEFEH
jgi:hypothetical protein